MKRLLLVLRAKQRNTAVHYGCITSTEVIMIQIKNQAEKKRAGEHGGGITANHTLWKK